LRSWNLSMKLPKCRTNNWSSERFLRYYCCYPGELTPFFLMQFSVKGHLLFVALMHWFFFFKIIKYMGFEMSRVFFSSYLEFELVILINMYKYVPSISLTCLLCSSELLNFLYTKRKEERWKISFS
jgi:hypothetical protein